MRKLHRSWHVVFCFAASAVCVGASGITMAGGIQTLDTVEVLGRRDDLVGTADSANQGTVTRQQLESRPILRPGEVMETVPGIIVTQHGGDGKANQYFLRGFNLDHGTDLATWVAGMPVNNPTHGHGQGYTDLNFMIPELISRVQYKKGTYYAEEGDFSAAGAVHIDYVNRLDENLVEVGAGSFGFRRTLLAGSPVFGAGNLLYAVEAFHNDGPWENPENYRKLNTVLRYSEGSNNDGFAVTGMAYRGQWSSTDQIPQRAVDSGLVGRFGSLDKSDGGATHRYSLSGEWARKHEAAVTRATAYVIDYQLDLFSNFTFFLDDPINGDQFKQADKRTVTGVNVGQSRLGKLGSRDTEHSYGVQLRHDDIKVGLFRTREREVLGTTREDDVNLMTAGVYYQNLLVWNDKLRTLAGVRTDFYDADVHSNNPANSGKRDANITSPKLSVILGPWSKTEYYFNVGRGFHSNDARGTTTTVDPKDPTTTVNPVTPLVRAKGAELGARTAIVPGLQSSLSLWRLDLASELLFIGDAGTTEAGRPSRRTGVEWANYWQARDWLVVDVDFAVSRARFTDDVPGSGNHIPGAIDKTVSVGTSIANADPWSGGVRLRYFGPRPLVEDNSARSRSSTLVNANVGYKIQKRVKLTFEVFNLANVKVNDIEYFYESQLQGEAAAVSDHHFHPAEPRSYRLMLGYRF
jgi:outer membrane receptor protein involved in Fe transport